MRIFVTGASGWIGSAVGRSLGLEPVSIDPADAVAHFGFIGGFFGADVVASSTATRAAYDWHPTGPTLVGDIENEAYAQ
ncbi:hypothetical protein [Microbacterium sp.]|uniref:hypothetical protein n=1 Tax=Microbacterium sp. TaxID=51671 RepID=UPI003C77F8F7